MHDLILRAWQNKNLFFYLVLIPLSWLFAGVTTLRRGLFTIGILKSYRLAVPVIIVGNINVGGSGKTPVVIWLADQLKKNGFRPGVISRGYGGDVTEPTRVSPDSLAQTVGDEPILIAKKTGCPVWVSANRVDAGNALLTAHPECDIIISDDGLQHYRLQRDIEIAVIDQQSQKEQRLLPAGPLRESFCRLNTVDAVISNGFKTIATAHEMQLLGLSFYNLRNPDIKKPVSYFNNMRVTAIAGIGKPDRFFDYLKKIGLQFTAIPFDDHYAFTIKDIANIECEAIIMTEKDAVKCQPFAAPHHWVLPVEATIDASFLPMILSKLQKI
jgi:tetraacyldisaccharide 4'-kinase